MPYSKDELDNLPFYQKLTKQDEVRYWNIINTKTDSGTIQNGTLRDKSGKIILFEDVPIDVNGEPLGQGTDGTSYEINHALNYIDGYFDYEDIEEELNKIIDREFTEL